MPGPPPKHPRQRRRRNATAAAAVLPAEGSGLRAPKLPGSKQMLSATRAWWREVWASPMAAQWIDADVPQLVRLAQLHDLAARQFLIVAEGPIPRIEEKLQLSTGDVREIHVTFESPVQAALLAEMRQLEDRLGLTPMARRRLMWEIGDAGDAPAEPQRDDLAARRARFARAAGR